MSTGKIVTAIAIAATILAVTVGLNRAEAEGMVSAETSARAAIVMAGLALAWYANEIPKAMIRSANARTARRFSGWAFNLAGLALILIYCLTTRQDPQATA